MGDTTLLIQNLEDNIPTDSESDMELFREDSTGPIRRTNRLMSIENTTLTEIITIYEKLKKGRENRVLRKSKLEFCPKKPECFMEAAEAVPMVPTFNASPEKSIVSMLDFNKFKNFRHSKYLYYSEKASLVQSDFIENLGQSFSELLKAKNYWMNIFDPDEEDFSILFNSYGVHDLTINDIREGYTEEKLEVFEHYTFVSMRLMSENKDKKGEDESEDDDVDFNILLFNDFVITIHERHWPSINDILGFLNLITKNSRTPLSPDWVFFSIFIEMNQDAKFIMNAIETKVDEIRLGNKSVEIMKRNFDLELEVYAITRFIKPKMKILRQLKQKCRKKYNKSVLRLLGDILEELGEQLYDLKQFNTILERSQDTFLALTTSDYSRQAIEANRVMKRVSEIALFFIPFNIIALFMGTNVEIPFQNSQNNSEVYFFLIILLSAILGSTLFLLRRFIFSY